jgi:hypothetical protein
MMLSRVERRRARNCLVASDICSEPSIYLVVGQVAGRQAASPGVPFEPATCDGPLNIDSPERGLYKGEAIIAISFP